MNIRPFTTIKDDQGNTYTENDYLRIYLKNGVSYSGYIKSAYDTELSIEYCENCRVSIQYDDIMAIELIRAETVNSCKSIEEEIDNLKEAIVFLMRSVPGTDGFPGINAMDQAQLIDILKGGRNAKQTTTGGY